MVQGSTSYAQLPLEILRIILSLALPPPFLLDSSIARGPHSPWSLALRFKKSIVRVCRAWYAAGIEFLYEDVVYRRLGQIPAFIRTLEASPILGDLVKKITITAYIPRRYGASFSERLQRVIALCPRLSHFTASPVRDPWPDTALLPTMDFHVTHLDFSEFISYSSIYPILIHLSGSLLSLAFHSRLSADLHKPIHFQQLHTLLCDILSPGSALLLDVITNAWSMPCLTHLSFSTKEWTWNNNTITLDAMAIHAFCMVHGRHLQFLLIGPNRLYGPTNIQEILDECPSLEHLIIRKQDIPLSIAHPKIKWIDFWPLDSPNFSKSRYPWKKDGPDPIELWDDLPSLQCVRTLMYGLPCYDIGRLVHPTITHCDETSIRYPGIYIRSERGFLFNSTSAGTDAVYASGFDWEFGEEEDASESEYAEDDEDAEDDEHDATHTDSESYIPDTASPNESEDSCGSPMSESGSWYTSSSDSCYMDVDMHTPEFSESASDSD